MRYMCWYLLAAFVVVAASDVEAYSGLVGAEFMVYPLDGWTADVSSNTIDNGYISFVPFNDNTNVAFNQIRDDGSEVTILNVTVNKGMARDIDRQNDGSGSGPYFIHVLANDSGYLYVGSYGALRSPPASGGEFLADEFIVHWPDYNTGPWTTSYSPQFIDICTTENGTVNVTVTAINASTGAVSSFAAPVGGSVIDFNITGNGILGDVVCQHLRVAPTGNSSPGLTSTTAIINSSGGLIHIVQHLFHIDTMNWLGAYDTGLLLGKYYVFGSGYTGSVQLGVSVYNPSDNSVFCDYYCNTSSRADAADHIFTVGTASALTNSLTIAAHDTNYMYVSSTSAHCRVNCTGDVSIVAGAMADNHDFDSPGGSGTNFHRNHLYSRVPPVDYSDDMFTVPFFMQYEWVDTGNHGGENGGASWTWYQISCYPPTVVTFNHSSTVCFTNTASTGYGLPPNYGGTSTASPYYPLGFQGVNSTVLLYNDIAGTTNNMTVVCGGSNTVQNLGGGVYKLENCTSMYTGDSNTYNGTINITGMNVTASITGTNTLYLWPNNTAINYRFGFFLNGRIQLRWTNAGRACLDTFILGSHGVLHMSGTDSVYANGTLAAGYGRSTALRFNSDQPVQPYRISSAPCSNSPIESVTPYLDVGVSTDRDVIKWSEYVNISVYAENVGVKESYNTILVHTTPAELKVFYTLPEYFKINFRDINGTIHDITHNVTFNSSSNCSPTDIHAALPGYTGFEPYPPVICVRSVDVGMPYTQTEFYFNLGMFDGATAALYGERINFTYLAYAQYAPPGGVGSAYPVYPDVRLDYQYCSAYYVDNRTVNETAETAIVISELVVRKTLDAIQVPYANNTNVTIVLEFGDVSGIYMRNVTVIDFFDSAVNFTYIGNNTDVPNGTYSTYENYDGGAGSTIYVNKTNINISNWGYDIFLPGNLSFIYNYTNTSYLRFIQNGTLSSIEIPLQSNGSNPTEIKNCVNVTYVSCKNESNSSCNAYRSEMYLCFTFTSTSNSTVYKIMDKENFTVGETGIAYVQWSTYPSFNTYPIDAWAYFEFCDELPAFLNYTGVANLTTTNPDGSINTTYAIGSNNRNWTSSFFTITNGWYLERAVSEYTDVYVGGKRRVCWRLLYNDEVTNGNMTNWTLTMETVAFDYYNLTETAANYTIMDRNFGHVYGVHFGQDVALETTPWFVYLTYLANVTLNKTITNLTRNYANISNSSYPGGPVEPGDYVYYSIYYVNDVYVQNLEISDIVWSGLGDTIPSNTTLVYWTNSTNSTSGTGVTNYSINNTYYWNITNMSANSYWLLNFTLFVHSNASVIENNTVCLKAYDIYNYSFTACDTTPQVPVIHPTLNISKYINDSGTWTELTTAEPGDDVEFIIVFSNPSEAHAYNVTFIDRLPPWFRYVTNSSYIVNYSGSDVFIGDGNVTSTSTLSTGVNITWNLSWYSGLVSEGPANYTSFTNYSNVLEPGENITIKFRAHVTSNVTAALNTNWACTNGTDLPSEFPWGLISQVCDYAQVLVNHPELTLIKTGSKTQALLGDTVRYTILITNPSDATAYNVSISDDLETGFKLISNGTLTLWNGTVLTIPPIETLNETSPPAGSLIHWNLTPPLDIPPQQAVNLTYNTLLTSGAKCGINVVKVNYTDGDGTPMPSLQSIWEVCPVLREGGLNLDKMSIDSIAHPGNSVTYEIIISNAGAGDLDNITLNDTLPAVPVNWTYVNNSIIIVANSTCTVTHNGTHFIVAGSMSPGDVCRFRYDVQVPDLTCFGEYVNYITASAYYSNVTLTASSSDSTNIVPDVILDVSKNINGELKYDYGSVIGFVINVTSRGNTTVYNVTVNDTLPYGLDYYYSTNSTGGAFTYTNVSDYGALNTTTYYKTGNSSSGVNVVWYLGNITGGSSKLVYVYANVTGYAFEGMNINKVVATGSGPCGPTVTDYDIVALVIGVPEPEVDKWADGGSIQPNGQMTYHIRIKNTGTGTAFNLNVSDLLTGMAYVPDSSVFNGSNINDPVQTGSTLVWNSATLNNIDLASGSSVILDFNLTTESGQDGCSVNMGMDAAYAGAYDGVGSIISNTDSVNTEILRPFITVTKYANVTKAEAGDLIKYTITVRNPSRADAYNVTVTDILQSGFTFNQSIIPAIGATYDSVSNTLTWPAFNLPANNANTTIHYTGMATPNASAPAGVNKAVVSAVDASGCALVNDSDAWGVIIFRPAVQIKKHVNTTEASPGDVLGYEISVFNPSEARAYNVSVYDFNQTGFYPTGGTADVYELKSSGFKEFLSYITTINILNAFVKPLEVNKAVDPAINQPVEPGTVINYTIAVANYDEDDAINVTIEDSLPTGLTATGNCRKNGTIITCASGSTVNFTNQNISANTIVVYTIEVSVNSSASNPGINTVTVNGSTADGDNYTTTDTETIKVAAPNLKIFKATSTPTIESDENATFMITVRNDGTAGAANITINESVDCGGAGTLEYAGSLVVITASSASSCTNNITNISGGFLVNTTLSKGEQCVFTYTMHPTNTTPHTCTNLVVINESYYTDGTPTNQNPDSTATVQIIPQINVTVTKTVDRTDKKYQPGDTVNYTINVTNDGSTNRTFNLHNDTLPDGLVFIDSNCSFEEFVLNESSGSYENTVTFSLLGNENMICWIAANVTSSAASVTTNNITVGVNDSEYNKSASGTIFVMKPNLTIDKASMNNSMIDPGDNVTYKIRVTNIGMGDARNINVTDELPGGFLHTTIAYNIAGGCSVANTVLDLNTITFTINRINGTNGTGNSNNYCTFYYNVSVPETSVSDGVKTNTATITYAEDNSSTPLGETQGNGTSDDGTIMVIADYTVTAGGNPAIYFDLSGVTSTSGSIINGSLASYAGITIKFNMTAGINAATGYDEAWVWGHYYDNTPASSDYDREYVFVNYPYIDIEKFSDVSVAKPGDAVNYTIRITNAKSSKSSAVIWGVTDELPYGSVLASNGTGMVGGLPFNFTANSTTGSIEFTLTNGTSNFAVISPGNELIFNFITYINSSSDLQLCDVASYNATDMMNNSIIKKYAEKCIKVLKPGVRITKLSDITTSEPGGIVTFTLKIENTGDSPLYNVTINDTMSEGWDYLTNVSSGNWNLNPPAGMIINESHLASESETNNTEINITGAGTNSSVIAMSKINNITRVDAYFNIASAQETDARENTGSVQATGEGGTLFLSINFSCSEIYSITNVDVHYNISCANPPVEYGIYLQSPDGTTYTLIPWGNHGDLPDGWHNLSIHAFDGYDASASGGIWKLGINASGDGAWLSNFKLNITGLSTKPSDYNVTLRSPEGTEYVLLDYGSHAQPQGGWTTGLTDFNGEDSTGNWSLNVTDTNGTTNTTLLEFGLIVWGRLNSTNYNNTVSFTNITLNPGDVRLIEYTAMITDNASEGINENCANATGYTNSGANYTDGYCISVMVYTPALELIKDVSRHDVEPGSEPIVTIIIENPTYATVYNVSITDYMPRGFNYTRGSAKLDGVPIGDPNITGTETFDCGDDVNGQLNLTWNRTTTNYTVSRAGILQQIPPKTIKVLTFKVHVKCNVANDTFNNTVNVSGVSGAGGAVGPESAYFEMKGYLADAEIYKYASNNAPTYFEYVDYRIVIWNNPAGANIAPLTLADTMPPYLQYVPGYAYVGDLKLEPAVCGDYGDKINGTMTNVQTDSSGVNCAGFNGTLVDSSGSEFNGYNETAGDGKGQTLLWNLSKWLFLTPGQQVTLKYRTKIIPGIARTARNDVTLSYLDPEHPDLCLDCEFDMSTSAVIAVNSPPGFVPEDVNYTLNLNRGWNLISVPIRPYDTSLSSVLAPVEGRYLDVASWDSQWVYRSYAYGDWFGSLSTIEPGKGYWLNMMEPASLTVSGEEITAFNLTLHGGWNLIGWPSLEPVPLSSLSVNYVDAAMWENRWVYRSYAYGDWFGSLSTIEPGKGYWLNVREDAVIQNSLQESGSGGSQQSQSTE